jgi:hypothetical protein
VGDIPQSKDPARGIPVATVVRPVDATSLAAGPLSMSLWVLLTLAMASGAWAAAPVVDSFSASPAVVAPGGLVALEVTAHDPDCPSTCTTGCGMYLREDLTAWSASGGTFVAENNGTSGSPYVATADWSAPAVEGTYTISVYLADSGSFLCGGRQSTTAQLSVLVTTSPNSPPEISLLTADPAQLFPGETSVLRCVASDPDGDPLVFSWTSDVGTVIPGVGGAAVFEAGDPGVATVTCTVADTSGASSSAQVGISVVSAVAERSLRVGLAAPQKVSVDSMGDLYVADRSAGGITVIHLFSGALVYRLPIPEVSSVAIDWLDDVLVGTASGAQILDRAGILLLDLEPTQPLGPVADVAVDPVNHRYAALYQTAGRVVVYDDSGTPIASFGSTGDGPQQLKSPQGLAFTPSGDLVVADSGHGLIKIFDLAGSLLGSFGGLGSGAGEFVRLADVEVGPDGVVYASDAFQDWVQTFDQAGSPREVIGTYGEEIGQFKTATGVLMAEAFNRLVVASANGPSLEVFLLDGGPIPPEPLPIPSLSDTTLDFGDQPVGSLSNPLTVTLSNLGAAPLGLRHVILEGDFTHTDDCGSFLDPGEFCTLEIRFAPTVPGTNTGSMQIDTSAENGLLTVELNGVGVVPPEIIELTPAPDHLQFGTVPVGNWSDPQTVSVTNTGTVTTAIDAVIFSGLNPGDFFLDGDLCTGAALDVGQSCNLAVVFAPTVTGDRSAEIAIQTASGPIFSVGLSGGNDELFADGFESGDLSLWSASLPSTLITIEPATVDFGRHELGSETATRSVTVTNRSDQAVFLGPLDVAGGGGTAFQLVSDRCSGVWLAEGQSCGVVVRLLTLDEGSFSVSVEIPVFADNDRTRGYIRCKGTVLWPHY